MNRRPLWETKKLKGLISEKRTYCDWRPLVSGDPESVHNAGISLRDRAVSDHYVKPEDLEAFVLEREGN